MLRCVLKQGPKFYCLYWIERNGNGPVVGRYHGTYISEVAGFPVVDEHFTYPVDGKLHHSFKNMETEQYLTAHPDRLRYKRVPKDYPKEEKILDGKHPLNILIPDQILPPLSHYEQPLSQFHHFPVQAMVIPLASKWENFLHVTEEIKLKSENDIVIDVDLLGKGTINVGSFIAHRDYVHFDPSTDHAQLIAELNGLSKIGLWMKFCPEFN